MPLFLLRSALFSFIIGNLFEYPLFQAILITILSLSMLLYLLVLMPLKSTLELVQLALNELLCTFVNIFALTLAIYDALEIKDDEIRANLGEGIIKMNMIFCSLSLGFLAIQLFLFIHKIYKILRIKTKKNYFQKI